MLHSSTEFVKGVTLLSADEAENLLTEEQRKCRISKNAYTVEDSSFLRNNNCYWWLRTPGKDTDYISYVDYIGNIHRDGGYVFNLAHARPALIIDYDKLNNFGIGIGDSFGFGDYTFTIISDKYALCDEAIKLIVFRKDYTAENANNYEYSDIKEYLDGWFEENM